MWSGIWSVATTWIGFWIWIWSTRHWTAAGSGLLISMLGKLNWFCLTGLITLVLFLWKWIGLFGRKNHLLRCWGWLSPLNWIEAHTLSAVKSDSKKIRALIRSMKFFSPELALYLYKSTIAHVWNTIVTSWLMPLVASWNCYTSYQNKYAGLLVHHFLLPLNPWLIVEMWSA